MSMPINQLIRRLAWALLGIIIVAVALDLLVQARLTIARGAGAGALLSLCMQTAYSWLSYRRGRAVRGAQAFADMSLAMLAKWLIALAGFAFIFNLKQPLAPWAVFVGFIAMQVLTLALYAKLGKKA